MTNIYLIRHAQSEGNLAATLQGQLDSPLTELGRAQATALGLRLAADRIQAVYSSPLVRAYHTAQAVAAPHRLKVSTHRGLMEINDGEAQGMSFEQIRERYGDIFSIIEETPQLFRGFKGGESTLTALGRMAAAMREIAEAHSGQRIAVLSHGFVIRCFICQLLCPGLEKLKEVPHGKNTAIWNLTYADGVFTVHSQADISHLESSLLGWEWEPEAVSGG